MTRVAASSKRGGSLSLFLFDVIGNLGCISAVIRLELFSNIWLLILTNLIVQTIPAFGRPSNVGNDEATEMLEMPEKRVPFIRRLALIVLGALGWHIIAVIYGAYVLSEVHATVQFAILMSILTVMPFVLQHGMYLESSSMKIAFSNPCSSQDAKLLVKNIGWTSAGVWLSSATLILDWDRPWQIWPFPCVVGAIAGHLLGCAAKLMAHQRWKSSKAF